MSLIARRRTRVLLAAVVTGSFIIPTTTAVAASDGEPAAKPAPAEQATAGIKDAPDGIRIKVGIDKDKLDALRAAAKKARAEGRQPNFANQPLKMGQAPTNGSEKDAAPDLTLLQGAKLSDKGAATNAAGDTDGAGATTKAGPSLKEYVPDPTGGDNHQGWVPIGNEPDSARLDACFDGLGLNESRVWNRYTTCSKYRIKAEYWSVDNSGVPVEHEGDTFATIKVFGQGDAKERRTRIFSEIEKDSVDYQWGPIDDWWTAPGVPLSLMGQCSQDYTTCGAAPSSYTYPWATWDNNPTWAHWDISNFAEKGKGRDKISYNQWYVEFFTDGGGYKTFDRGETPERVQRCDSASYMRDYRATFPQACIFSEVVPHLTYSTGNNNHHGVSDHIQAAFNNPNNTYPSPVPPQTKNIPGQYTGAPNSAGLHRITQKLHKATYDDNRAHKDGACYGRGKYKDLYEKTGIPVSERPDTSYQDCDEFPFASTLEGAASTKWDFSVKAVDKKQNQEAGRMLRRYYLNDRILAWDESLSEGENDEYYVRIR